MEFTSSAVPSSHSKYLARIRAYPVLTREAEVALARKYRNEGDKAAARTLVESNLRFVVKICSEYRTYGIKMEDLIQEGNLGLMQAVERFDPEKGYRLISYAVWWIRAYVHNLILRSWSLVKMGTTQAQRRLFYQLGRAKRRITELQGKSHGERVRILAEKLDATEDEIREMEQRMTGRDVTLDTPVGDDTDTTFLDLVPSKSPAQDTQMLEREEMQVLRAKIVMIAKTLPKRERFILENRILSESPMTLRDIGTKFGISRERIRQLEVGIIEKLRDQVASELGIELKGKIKFAVAAD